MSGEVQMENVNRPLEAGGQVEQTTLLEQKACLACRRKDSYPLTLTRTSLLFVFARQRGFACRSEGVFSHTRVGLFNEGPSRQKREVSTETICCSFRAMVASAVAEQHFALMLNKNPASFCCMQRKHGREENSSREAADQA